MSAVNQAWYRRYVWWMRLTHHGRRSPSVPCGECGLAMSEAEVAEYRQFQSLQEAPGASGADSTNPGR
jgi:hypothetical protein